MYQIRQMEPNSVFIVCALEDFVKVCFWNMAVPQLIQEQLPLSELPACHVETI